MQRPGKALWAVFALIGFTAVVAQVMLMRELIVVFYGNEISLGLMLAAWLLWTAFGSGVLGRLVPRMNPRRLVASLQLLASAAFPVGILLARACRLPFQTVPGEMLGPGTMLAGSAASLGVFCAISGWLFAATARLAASESGLSSAQAASSVYAAEAAGSAAGGLLASLVFVRWLAPMEIAALLAALNVLAAVALFGGVGLPGYRLRSAFASVALAVTVAAAALAGAPTLERISLAWLWRGFQVIDSRNSLYGNLVVTRTGDNLNLYENGLPVATVPDPAAAEEAVHYALLQHPAPRFLLLIGGGANGSIAQALLHPSVERIDYVELDPAIIAIAQRYFPLPGDPRLHVHETDGRLFLRHAGQRFDVVIVNLPEPQTAQLNRFYTVEFFREAAARLAPGGVFSFALPASETYISPELADFLRSIHHSLRTVFPQVTLLPGETVHFFASASKDILMTSPDAVLARLRQRRLSTVYVSEYFLPFRMSPERMRDLEERIRPLPSTPLNRDFTPVAYYYDNILWHSLIAPGARSWLRSLAEFPFAVLFVTLALLLVVVATLPRPGSRPPVALAVASMGCVMMGLEVLLLLAFQAIHGYVYHQLALVIAGFMAGMAAASRLALRRGSGWSALITVQALGAAAPLVLYAAFLALARLGNDALSQILFSGLAIASGALGGYQFPVASRIFHAASKEDRRGLGSLYSLDLAGSCIAALVLSAWVIPVYGFLRTALLLSLVNAVPAALLWRRSPVRRSLGGHHLPG